MPAPISTDAPDAHSVGCGECAFHEADGVSSIPMYLCSKQVQAGSAHPRRRSEDLKTPWLLLAIYGESMQRGVFSRVDPSASSPLRAIPPADRSVLESALMLCGVVERLHHADFHPLW